MIRDLQGSMIEAYSKLTGKGFAIEAKVVALLEDVVQAKVWTYPTSYFGGGGVVCCCYLKGG